MCKKHIIALFYAKIKNFKLFVLPFAIFDTIYRKGKICNFSLSRAKNDTFLSKNVQFCILH